LNWNVKDWNVKEMKIIAGTDFHGSRSAFENFAVNSKRHEVDLAVICGDITNFGTVEQAKNLLTMLAEINIPTIFVPGNCDPPSLVDLNLNGLTCIHGKLYVNSDLAFIGLGGGTVSPFNTFFEMREEEIAKILRRCAENLRENVRKVNLIFVSHTPPKNTRLDRTFMGVHAGSTSVRRFIEENRPLLTLCGHIHEARGVDRVGDTLVVNPGPAKQGNYAIVTIKGGEVNVELRREEI